MVAKFKPSLYDVEASKQLMSALHIVDPSSVQFWYDPIRECLEYFELPDYVCDDCKETKMTFWNYHLAQGMCEKCTSKYKGDENDCV
jgi:hypothetical protein